MKMKTLLIIAVALIGLVLLGHVIQLSEELSNPTNENDHQRLLERYKTKASSACRLEIEKQAKYGARWDWFDTFKTGGGSDDKPGFIFFCGDSVEFKNGFGNWIRHHYQCDYEIATGKAVVVWVEPGKLN